MATLMLVRHGQASLFAADYDRLSPLGERQCVSLGEYWARMGFRPDLVFSGPAKRHRDTARIVADTVRGSGHVWPEAIAIDEFDEHDALALVRAAVPQLAHVDRELAELAERAQTSTSPHERSRVFQLVFETVMRRWLDHESFGEHIETWPHFAARIQRALTQVVAQTGAGKTAVVFSSVGPAAVVLREALQTSDVRSFETAWRLRNASLTSFKFDAHRLTLDMFNALPHLDGVDAWTYR